MADQSGNKKQSVITFLKSQLASMTSSSVDFGTTILLMQGFKMWIVPATVIGVIAGGITNFLVNRNFAFQNANPGKKRNQAWRFFIVWFGNLLLNAGGAHLFADIWHFPKILSKLVVSLSVGFFYNFPLLKYFVFRKDDKSTVTIK